MKKHLVTVQVAERGMSASNEQKRLIKAAAVAALIAENADKPYLVSVFTANDAYIRTLNLETRNVDSATDVLSFPNDPEPWEVEDGRAFLGDIVISLERAAEQAEEYGHSIERELAFLTVHAVLHLLGYDHERSKKDEKLHFSRQDEILKGMGITRD